MSSDSFGRAGGSLRLAFDFDGLNPLAGPFGGIFASLFGLTDTKVVLQPGQSEPAESTNFADYYLDFDDIYGSFAPTTFGVRSLEQVAFDVRLESGTEPVTLKLELKDESGFDVFTRVVVSSTDWQPIVRSRGQFNRSVEGEMAGHTLDEFDWNRVSLLSLIVERRHVFDDVTNPNQGILLIDNIRLIDPTGVYPDLAAAKDPIDGTLQPQYEEAFLQYIRALSSLYFVDFASRDTTFNGNEVSAGGIIQDRSTFADLMTVGGAGFQLTSYVIDAERNYIPRAEAATRVHSILQTLHEEPQGSGAVGTAGYHGFFYHFLGIDGLRKQNFDFDETPVNEASNTVELSTIDTALALAGVLTAREYFDRIDPIETEIRAWADAIYSMVDWEFMLYRDEENSNDPQNYQFFLGWKPNEVRDDSGRFGRFQLNDTDGLGQYSSKLVDGVERPATLDFYTDEALLIALLAYEPLNAIEPGLGQKAWNAIARVVGPEGFVTTFPGSLFTYQFLSSWVDTSQLGADNHPVPTDLFENTRAAIDATRQHTIVNPNMRATWDDDRGAELFGLSAAEGPFDDYFAYSAPGAALGHGRLCLGAEVLLEAEHGSGAGSIMSRGSASNAQTVLLHQSQTRSVTLNAAANTPYTVFVAYSNDGAPDTIEVAIDGMAVQTFETVDTRLPDGVPGSGWNVFSVSDPIDLGTLSAGEHDLELRVVGADQFGVELDLVTVLVAFEDGTVTNYGVGSSIVHRPESAIAGLWKSSRLDTENNAYPELMHPRFGLADAFNLDVAAAAIPGCFDPGRVVRGRVTAEAELGTGSGTIQQRSAASNKQTVLLHIGDSRTTTFSVAESLPYYLAVRYSNDGASDTISVTIDGGVVQTFTTTNTTPPGGVPGSGWNVFTTGGLVNLGTLSAGQHQVQVLVTQADQFGVEIDAVLLVAPSGPWANFNGFAIDHGPMLIMIDNYLEDQFVPGLFMSHPQIRMALAELFPSFHALAADYNDNGTVDAADYTVWRDTLGSTSDLRADGSGPTFGIPDGVVDQHDYQYWKANFGNTLSLGSGAGATGLSGSNARLLLDAPLAATRPADTAAEDTSDLLASRSVPPDSQSLLGDEVSTRLLASHLAFADVQRTGRPGGVSFPAAPTVIREAMTVIEKDNSLLAWLASDDDGRDRFADACDSCAIEIERDDGVPETSFHAVDTALEKIFDARSVQNRLMTTTMYRIGGRDSR